MRIVFISQYFMPELGATSELLSGVAAKLAERGFKVSAIAGQPSYFGAARVDRVLELNGVIVRRVLSTQFDKNTTYGRALNAATFAASMFWSLLFVDRRSLIVAVTAPPILPWVCYAAHRLVGSRYVVLIHDVYPDIAVALGALKKGGWIARMWRRLNALALDAAERIVVLGRDMEELINQQVGARSGDQITIVPNWADGEKVSPIDRSTHPVLTALGALDRFVVLYSGNIGRFHEIKTILDAAARLDGDSGFLFLFYGEGKQVELVRGVAHSLRNGSIRLLPYQPRERLGQSLTGCDVGLVTLKAGLSGMAVPSKLYAILAAGKPVVVIGPEDCEAARLVTEEHCGVVASPGNGEGLAKVLLRLRDDPAVCAAYGLRARRAFEGGYDLRTVAAIWAELFSELDNSA